MITYTSKATNDVIKDGEIENKIIADGKWSQTNKVTLKQQNIIKKHNKMQTIQITMRKQQNGQLLSMITTTC